MKKAIFALAIISLFVLAGCAREQQAATDQKFSDKLQEAEDFFVVEVSMSRYRFNPNPIKLKQGIETTMEFTSNDVPHGFYSEELGIDIYRVDPGQKVTFKITPEKTGIFDAKECETYCGAGDDEINGKIAVE